MRILVGRFIAAGLVTFWASLSSAAVVIKDCDEQTTVNLETGLKFYEQNWDEFEKLIAKYGTETASCMRNLVKNGQGTVICDMSDCPMPGFKGWVIKPIPEANLCPWYINEKMSELRRNPDKVACLSSTAVKLFGITCQGDDEEGHPVDTDAFNFYKSKNRDIRAISMDCGHNSLKAGYFEGK